MPHLGSLPPRRWRQDNLPDAAAMIATLVERDLPFYDPAIGEPAVAALNRFAQSLGLLTAAVPYDRVVATGFRSLWHGA